MTKICFLPKRSGSSEHVINTGQLRSGKTLPCPTNLNSCCIMLMAEPGFGVSSKQSAWTHPAWCQRYRMVRGMFSWHMLSPLITIVEHVHALNNSGCSGGKVQVRPGVPNKLATECIPLYYAWEYFRAFGADVLVYLHPPTVAQKTWGAK
jgi:hypothetical protein